jgi:methanogenic corrinoid protein MtbC1
MARSEAIGSKAAEAIVSQHSKIARRILDLHYRGQPGLWERYGEGGRKLCQRDIDYHLSYLIASVEGSDPSLFQQYICWVRGLFENMGLPDRSIPDTLAYFRQALQEILPPPYRQSVLELLDSADAEATRSPAEDEIDGADDKDLTPTAREYIAALLRGDRNGARQLILKTFDAGISVRDIYITILQPAQREIGRLWYKQEISVAEEHYCTAATQLIMSSLYPHIFSTPKSGKRLVIACAEGELHEIGARMVADFFEIEGWDTYYLGADMPAREIANVISSKRPDVLALSATLSVRISSVARVISEIVQLEMEVQPKIIVGGRAFAVRPGLFQEIGAHGHAVDAEGAVRLAHDLLHPKSG